MGGQCCSERKGVVAKNVRQQSFGLFSLFGGDTPCVAHTVTDEVFKKYDKDGNGQMDKTELGAFFRDAFPEIDSSEKIEVMMNVVDLDGDGTVGVNEVRAFLRHYNPATKAIKIKTALIVIDVQNDFMTGTLANQHGAHVLPGLINGMRDKFDFVVISSDWHPHDHCSFVESANDGKVAMVETGDAFDPFTNVTLKADLDRDEHTQTLYPRHAVADTEGGADHGDLITTPEDGRIYKGTKANIDSYSAFFDNCKANDTGLTQMLEDQGVTDVYCCGLVFDICVKSSALHGAEMGFTVAVIEEACRPLSMDNNETTRKELADAGVSIVSVEEAVARVSAKKEFTIEEYMRAVAKGKQAKKVHNKMAALSSHAPHKS